ncbi:MAG TPA: hypothetical protein VMS64_05640 [Candidatus Methylomirabilis sp.]|nr:hypothetical protein [Candidatus Methylomirabilis sp.]
MLTEAQRRALTAGLGHIEAELDSIETLLDRTREGLLATYEDDLPDSAHRRLHDRIDEARAMIRGLASTLGLEPVIAWKSHWIIGHLALLWVATEECQSRYLRAYGDVAPDLPALVDPMAHRLGEVLLAMQDMAHEAAGQAATSAADVRARRAP